MAQRICGMLVTMLLLAARALCADAPRERIAFQRDDPPAVTVMFADGSGASDLPQDRKFTGECITPALSPNGVMLAVAAPVGDQFKLFTWRLDEANGVIGSPKRVTPWDSTLSERYPSWSPDGSHLAFLAMDAAQQTTLRVIGSDGSGMVTLAVVSFLGAPTWSPDGTQLLYIDMLNGHPTLFNIPAAGGVALPVRPGSKTVAACFSPDGNRMAALIQGENGMDDLYLLPPFGVGGQVILQGISGGKCLNWRLPDRITLNAAKVGKQDGFAFWMVAPDGKGLHGVTGYADPAAVANFSLERCDLTPYVPAMAAIPTVSSYSEPPTPPARPFSDPATELLLGHPLAILSPAEHSTLSGTVTLRIMARKSVAKVAILVNGQLIDEEAVDAPENSIPRMSYAWDTRALRTLDAPTSLPDTYQATQAYPDGTYTLCVEGLDSGDLILGQHTITVTLQNEMPADRLTGRTFDLHYSFQPKYSDLTYLVHGEASLFGGQAKLATALNDTLDVTFHRAVDPQKLANGFFGFNVGVAAATINNPLVYNGQSTNIPETFTHGAYSLGPHGELEAAVRDEDTLYLPLAQLSVPFMDTPAKFGEVWTRPMWVVTDLLDREATRVAARVSFDGVEVIDGKQLVRIRANYTLDDPVTLSTSPTQNAPGARGDRAAFLQKIHQKSTALPVTQAGGVRYAWFDMENSRLVRVIDLILYQLPGKGFASSYYLVKYEYTLQTDAASKG